jgi:hypothetical protein
MRGVGIGSRSKADAPSKKLQIVPAGRPGRSRAGRAKLG